MKPYPKGKFSPTPHVTSSQSWYLEKTGCILGQLLRHEKILFLKISSTFLVKKKILSIGEKKTFKDLCLNTTEKTAFQKSEIHTPEKKMHM